ncbi:sensor histidine kinase [Aeromicrobium piscarium]|uniref:histidine kinase n=1 Tax=Aeromicrobium piscarium TaxID=2590901 RepID=A0A554SGY7_9ACTN|nr:sensor histidine kinase [Aeromicrobium piscarium]TSD65615.1 ATPase [Aeromicrobium piscarium]
MPTLEDIADSQSSLSAAETGRLQALVARWQMIADLAFCDLVLWVADVEGKGWWAAAQIRPATGPTTLLEDIVGSFVPREEPPGEEQLPDGVLVQVETIPVRYEGCTIALLGQRRYREARRFPGALEQSYAQTSDVLLQMVREGRFPVAGTEELADTLRVGDGLIRADASGRVGFVSPNAMSAYRRLGLRSDLVGADLVAVTSELLHHRPTDRGFAALFGDTESVADVEGVDASLRMQIVPLTCGGHREGYLVLLRDVTELRLRERELVSKEATIREIHHRVKNNLQTVAALLRLQSRRVVADEAKEALREAERRVGSIALVHETLSQSFDEMVPFDDVADTLLRTIPEFADQVTVRAERIGSFGLLPGEVATSLAMVLSELLQNAVEHAFTSPEGRVTVAVNRIRGRLRLRVSDDGRGFDDDFDAGASLGLSIATTLVESELGGSLSFERSPLGGAMVTINVDLA